MGGRARAARPRRASSRARSRRVEYKGKIWAIPFTSNTQLLWYRKDRVDEPPEDFTWDEMIDQAAEDGKAIEVQGAQYEGLTVWINSLIAGRRRPDRRRERRREGRRERHERPLRSRASSRTPRPRRPACPPTRRTRRAWASSPGRSDYQVNYTFIYPSAEAIEGFQEKIGWARYPRTTRTSRAGRRSAGSTSASRPTRRTPDLAFDAAECLASEDTSRRRRAGRPAAHHRVALRRRRRCRRRIPFADLLRESIDAAAPRPVTPAYSDISLAIQKTFHPPDGTSTRTGIEEQAAGPHGEGGRGEDLLMEAAHRPPRATATARGGRRRRSPTAPRPSASSRGCCARPP